MIDTADAKRDRNDPATNEYAAHDAARHRSRLIRGRTSGGRRL